MKTLVTQQQIDDYRENGFLLIENFLDTDELPFWREAVTETVEQRGDRKLPDKETKTGEDNGVFKLYVRVPENTSAEISVPGTDPNKIKINNLPVGSSSGIKTAVVKNGRIVFKATPGEYQILSLN